MSAAVTSHLVCKSSMSHDCHGCGREIPLFDFSVFDTTLPIATSWIISRAINRVSTRIAFINAHCINVSYKDGAYRNAIASCDRLFADGCGVAIAARIQGYALADNINGTDLFPELCAQAAKHGIGMFLFGGLPGIAESAANQVCSANPSLKISGFHHGYCSGTGGEEKLIAEINASGAQILLVGLGVPKQDIWLARNRDRLTPAVIIGVGGLFDYFSNRISRAPRVMRSLGLEWCWRLAMEPRRLARRYLIGNVDFLVRLFRIWLATKIQPAVPASFTEHQSRSVLPACVPAREELV